MYGNKLLCAELVKRHLGFGDDERTQAQHASEHIVVGHEVEVVDALLILVHLAYGLDGIRDGQVIVHGEEVGGHDAASRLLLIAEQRPHRG